MSDGCEQGERFPAALQEGYFRPDETSLETLIAMSAGLASHLRFHDVSMREVGTWGELFDGDEALVLARIAAARLQAAQQQFVRDADAAPLPELATRVMALASQIDGWLKALRASRHLAGRNVLARIEQLLEQPLGDDLQWVLERFGTHHFRSQPMALARRRFDPAWFRRPEMRDPSAQRSDREMLRRRFFSFVSAIERIQDLARELLPVSMDSQTHAPAAGLLMAFLQLYQLRIQPHLNRFTERHTDFYYDDCLRVEPLPATPDAVHLVCQRHPLAQGEVLVPRGTRFSAGKDAQGQPIEFEADDDLRITDCRVAALLTLRLDRDPLISPEREFGYVTRIDAARLPWPAPELAVPDAPHPHWPLFGGTPHGPAGGPAETRVGLAIASPLFLLAGGQREIDLRFELAQAIDVDHRLQHLAEQTVVEPRSMRRHLPVLFKRYLQLAPELLSALDRADLNDLALRLARQAQERRADEAADGHTIGLYERFLLELTVRAPTRELFFRRLGKLFSRWLLAREDWLTDARLKALRDTAARLLGETDRPPPVAGDPRCLLQGPNRPERALIFGQLFSSIFHFHLSTPSGWLAVNDFFVDRGDGDSENHGGGACTALRVVLRLRPQDPPVVGCNAAVHGAEWPTEQPVLRIQLCDEGRLHPYSLMEDVVLTEVAMAVRVQGVRDVVMHNNLGRLDPSKPFMPFGPLPTLASYCVFGSEELARKNVTRLDIQVEWSGLPTEQGGWASYYAGYDSHLRNSAYTATASILRDGQWHTAGTPGSLALFKTADAAGRLSARACWSLDEAALRTYGRATQEPLDFQLGARNGYYRAQLHAPAIAFGHAAYPVLLTEAVSANTLRRRSRRPLVLPNPPYTPLIERITLDYEAQSHIVLGHERRADGEAELERVLHLHPYGLSQVYPGATGAGPGLWPRFAHNGNLYIGLSVGPEGDGLSGTLTLHFHLRDESAVESLNGETREPPSWAYLASNQWRPLSPSQVVADTTCGFLTSGIVTLDLPPQADRLSTILPNACYWLRLSVDHGFEHYAGLYGVRTQALRASRVSPAAGAAAATPLPAGRVTEPLVTVAGLASVQQIGPSFGMRAVEDRRQMLTRVGERLQHRQRASTPWDYERLVLERFPSVLKVKCFAHQLASVDGVSPGEVLVVVVPAPPVAQAGQAPGDDSAAPLLSATAEPHLNAVELARIRDTLRGLASPFAQIQVRNPMYERIQVRCTVKLARGVQQGQALRRINQAITDYLSPWREGGLRPSFDWTVRCEDVEAHIRALDCVAFVTQLSLLHVARSDAQVYTLGDTARGQGLLSTQARPRSAWSIVLPMREHMVSAVEVPTDERPEATGIARLGLGHTFILGDVSRPSGDVTRPRGEAVS